MLCLHLQLEQKLLMLVVKYLLHLTLLCQQAKIANATDTFPFQVQSRDSRNLAVMFFRLLTLHSPLLFQPVLLLIMIWIDSYLSNLLGMLYPTNCIMSIDGVVIEADAAKPLFAGW